MLKIRQCALHAVAQWESDRSGILSGRRFDLVHKDVSLICRELRGGTCQAQNETKLETGAYIFDDYRCEESVFCDQICHALTPFTFKINAYGTRNVLRSGCLICEKCAEIRDLQRAQYVVK